MTNEQQIDGSSSAEEIQGHLLSIHSSHFVCSNETELVVEGFPRSANMFCVNYIEHVLGENGKKIKIAHHTHSELNVILGQKLDKAGLILVREPIDALVSYLIYYDGVKIDKAIDRYLKFYETVSIVKGEWPFVDFSKVTKDFNSLIFAINEKFDLGYPTSRDSTEAALDVQEKMTKRAEFRFKPNEYDMRISLPNEMREIRKSEIYADVRETTLKRPEIFNLYNFLLSE